METTRNQRRPRPDDTTVTSMGDFSIPCATLAHMTEGEDAAFRQWLRATSAPLPTPVWDPTPATPHDFHMRAADLADMSPEEIAWLFS